MDKTNDMVELSMHRPDHLCQNLHRIQIVILIKPFLMNFKYMVHYLVKLLVIYSCGFLVNSLDNILPLNKESEFKSLSILKINVLIS